MGQIFFIVHKNELTKILIKTYRKKSDKDIEYRMLIINI